MFKIRDNQFGAFKMASLTPLAVRVAGFLQQQFPEAKNQNQQQLAEEIMPILKKAESFGMETEQEYVIFVLAATYLGRDFDEALPEAHEILSDDTLLSSEKAEQLEKLTLAIIGYIEEQAGEK